MSAVKPITGVDLAAQMLGARDAGLLHYGLFHAIKQAEQFCNNTGRDLDMPCAIAAIIVAWEMTHPGEHAVGH
jgi:hypothetical protein